MSVTIRTHHTLVSELAKLPDVQYAQYAKGEYIYLPHDASHYMYVLTRGAIKIGGYASSGQEVMFDCLTPLEFFGNLQFLGGDFFTEFAKTLVASEVLKIPVQRFKQIVRSDKPVADWFHEVSTMRWWRAEDRLFTISSEKPLARVRRQLSLLDRPVRDTEDQAHALATLLSYQDLADLVGLSRQSTARLVKAVTAENKANDVKLS